MYWETFGEATLQQNYDYPHDGLLPPPQLEEKSLQHGKDNEHHITNDVNRYEPGCRDSNQQNDCSSHTHIDNEEYGKHAKTFQDGDERGSQ